MVKINDTQLCVKNLKMMRKKVEKKIVLSEQGYKP